MQTENDTAKWDINTRTEFRLSLTDTKTKRKHREQYEQTNMSIPHETFHKKDR